MTLTVDLESLKAITPILSAVAGGLIGFLSARMMWRLQERGKRKNIAAGFIIELDAIHAGLAGWAKILSRPGLVRVDTPLYPATGLYHAFQREIFSFDQPLSRRLFTFYSRVLEADQLRTMSPQDPRYATFQEGMAAALNKAVAQLPELITELGKETGSNEQTTSIKAIGA